MDSLPSQTELFNNVAPFIELGKHCLPNSETVSGEKATQCMANSEIGPDEKATQCVANLQLTKTKSFILSWLHYFVEDDATCISAFRADGAAFLKNLFFRCSNELNF